MRKMIPKNSFPLQIKTWRTLSRSFPQSSKRIANAIVTAIAMMKNAAAMTETAAAAVTKNNFLFLSFGGRMNSFAFLFQFFSVGD